MVSRFQGVALVAASSYPNAIAWSDENLIAVAAGHLVIILNPALPFGPRGLIRILATEPYPIGRIQRHDLLSDPLLPAALSKDRRPCVRSISWSPIGMAPNYGCLLAVCTIEGRVKLYRPPFCDFCTEWIEVIDITDRLYDYLASTNFGEKYKTETPSSEFSQVCSLPIISPGLQRLIKDRATQEGGADNRPKSCASDLLDSLTKKECKQRRVNVCSSNDNYETFEDELLDPIHVENANAGSRPHSKMGGKRSSKVIGTKSGKLETNMPENCTLPLITVDQYASRSGMLSSLVLAWSPVLWLSSKICSVPQTGSHNGFSVLAVGGKSGKIALWRIHTPQCYSIEHGSVSTCVALVGLIQAHNSWITSIDLALLGSKSNPQVLLASGSSDGSVKIWLGNGDELLKSSEVNNPPFFLVKEVISVNIVPVSVLSLAIPVHSLHKMLLAVGKGSGSVEVWTCDTSDWKFDKAGLYDAHDCIVTGLTWAFDGCCLYSCGQDNYVHGWVLSGNSLREAAIPLNTPGLRNSSDIPNVFLSCQGVAMSSGNLVVAMVRNLDVDQLDHMYEARHQKAVVEFFWIGGQQLDMLSPVSQDFGDEAFLGFSANELAYWESNILWSLKKYENPDEPLVIWDIIAALLAFKQSISNYVDRILVTWLSIRFLGSHMNLSVDEVLICIPESFSKITSRQLHLLNIICRRIILSELKADEINCKVKLGGPPGAEGERLTLWMELLFSSEKELRERLVAFSFSAFISQMSDSASTLSQPGYWYPAGVAQMKQWVALNHDHLRDQLKVLASEVRQHEKRLHSSEYGVEEVCIYCSASVPFDSPEVASCHCLQSSNGVVQNHKLVRCAVSMKVCPINPLWFCKCCHRRASKLPPETFFTMPGYPLDFKSFTESPVIGEVSKPLCPFCGILLQRLQPDFLLSTSPV